MSKELTAAIEGNDLAAAQRLIDAGVRLPPKALREVIYTAARQGREPMLKLLLERFKPKIAWGAVSGAIREQHLGVLRLLAEHGADMNWLGEDDTIIPTLHEAVCLGDPGLIETLVECGADVNARNKLGVTSLMELGWRMREMEDKRDAPQRMQAARERLLAKGTKPPFELPTRPLGLGQECIALLVKLGADASLKDNFGNDALDYYRLSMHEADKPIDSAVVEQFQQLGAAGDEATFKLLIADDVESSRIAIAAGADVNRVGPYRNETPLCQAAGAGDIAMMNLLIGAGADLNAAGRFTRPFIHAAAKGQLAAVNRLVEGGADVSLAEPHIKIDFDAP